MPNLRRGYLPPAVILFLAGLSLFVAAIIVFNTQLVKNEKKPAQTPPSPTPFSTPDTQSGPTTANWKTYTNSNYGYSIKYPADFTKAYESSRSIVLDGRIGTYKEGSNVLNGILLDLTVVNDKTIAGMINASKQDISTARNVNIGLGIQATQIDVKNSGQEDIYYYLQLPQQKVLVVRTGWTEKNSQQYSKLATQILSTFKFTN